MADNVAITPGTGATVAADEIGGILHQRIKISLGADGTANDAVAGAGVVGVDVQRMTLASNDPAVASLASILAKIIAAPATAAKQPALGTAGSPSADILSSVIYGAEGYGIGGFIPIAATMGPSARAILGVGAFNYVFDLTNFIRQIGDTNGTVNQPHAMSGSRWVYAAAVGGITSAAAVTIAAAGGASVRNYLSDWDLSWDALTAASEVVIRDGAAGTVLWRFTIPPAIAGSQNFHKAIPLKGTANTLMEVAVLTNPVAGGIRFNGQGFVGA